MSAFTVKWVVEDNGIERTRILDADQVSVAYDNRPPQHPGDPSNRVAETLGVYAVPRTGCVVIGNPYEGGESMCLAHGKVYVMNEQGATVSTHQLSKVFAPVGMLPEQTPAPSPRRQSLAPEFGGPVSAGSADSR